ncbi:MAG TPA: DUF3089 domain-containing protein [Solirubrobacterales bacterium]|nr:DUF3089 domain-containing protein [Solirubrobacterales bacterium]
MALIAVVAGFAAVAFAGPATAAEPTVWACLPGQTDDMCAGSVEGNILPAPGKTGGPLGYKKAESPPVDCFYLYPTQSPQDTPNSDLAKDPPIRRVVVQQARQFSRVCNVYAPMYRQSTSPSSNLDEPANIAYQSALDAWKDYLANYNKGRGFVLIGHSQGSSHLGRLIDEEIDPNPELRAQMVGAILPGANIHVPIGQLVGGMYQNVPACSKPGEFGCLVAYSMYRSYPGAVSGFGQLNAGYWSFPGTRPDPAQFEVVCVDPSRLDGGDGRLRPLANLDYVSNDPPASEGATPWVSMPDYYNAECMRQAGAHWLNVTKVDAPGDTRPDLASLVSPGNDLHLVDVNLAEDNLVSIARAQSDSYIADLAEREKIAAAKVRKAAAQKKLTTLKKSLKKRRVEVLKSNRMIKSSAKKCARAASPKAAACKAKKRFTRKKISAGRQIKKLNRQISGLNKEIKRLDGIIG